MQKFTHALYPLKKPLKKGYLKVSKKHSLYYAIYGNPKGCPVIVLHGGPGAGTSEFISKFFNLKDYFVVTFDQRGSLRSKPFASMEENTPQHSIEDIEKLRVELKIDKWLVFGGSWGSTLGLLYGQAHPERCLGFILRGVFLARKDDHLQVLYGAGKVYPEEFEELKKCIPENEHDDLFKAFRKRILNPDPKISLPHAKKFIRFNAFIATNSPDPKLIEERLKNRKLTLGMAKAFLYYQAHKFFLKPNQILLNMDKIQHLPCIIVHGRHDVICIPEAAFLLHKHWKKSKLWMIDNGGHADSDPHIAQALALATTKMKLTTR